MSLDIQQILDSLQNNSGPKLPPVHLWHPEREGVIDIHIDEQMRWTHEGGHFERHSIQRLLSTLLRKEGDHYFLVTPQEKLKISVADVPFEIINMTNNETDPGEKILITNNDDLIRLNETSQWELREYQGNLIPYVEVRNNLWARISRPVYYQMIAEAEPESQGEREMINLVSKGKKFILGTLEEK